MRIYKVLALLALAACGSPTAPPPVPTGTIFFQLSNCQAYVTAEYVADSISVGVEPIIPGVPSKGYLVPAGVRSAKAVVSRPGAPRLWTFNDRVKVPENGAVTAHIAC